MEANIHTPQRLEGESFKVYKERREVSHEANKLARKGVLLSHRYRTTNAQRRREVRQFGGIRQFNRFNKQARAALRRSETS